MSNPSYSPFELVNSGLLYKDLDSEFPTRLFSYVENEKLKLERINSTYFIFNYEGEAVIDTVNGKYKLQDEMYASIPDFISIEGGKGIVVERLNYDGFFNIGGPLEKKGRLKYIDGCTDSLLISPVRYGDACLNLLYFPRGINQTPHTHPSIRVGMIVSGKGECITPWGSIPLTPGQVFTIHDEGKTIEFNDVKGKIGTHSFRTKEDEMRVVAYHPDSDFGPQDEEHPMINRTIVDGKSAKDIKKIRTV